MDEETRHSTVSRTEFYKALVGIFLALFVVLLLSSTFPPGPIPSIVMVVLLGLAAVYLVMSRRAQGAQTKAKNDAP